MAEVDWASCDTDVHRKYTLESGSVNDVTTSVVEPHKQYISGSLLFECTLPLRGVYWVISAESHVTFDGAAALKRLEGDVGFNDMPSPIVMEDPFNDVVVNAKYDWDHRDITPSGVLDVRCSLRGDILAIRKKCRLHGLDGPANAQALFQTSL